MEWDDAMHTAALNSLTSLRGCCLDMDGKVRVHTNTAHFRGDVKGRRRRDAGGSYSSVMLREIKYTIKILAK